jgi:hypothetical protein
MLDGFRAQLADPDPEVRAYYLDNRMRTWLTERLPRAGRTPATACPDAVRAHRRHRRSHWCSNTSEVKFEVVPVSCSSWKQTHDIVPTSVVSEASL